MKGSKAKWIGQILHRNCLLKHITEEVGGGGRSDGKARMKT
jgi:hypothetical protein